MSFQSLSYSTIYAVSTLVTDHTHICTTNMWTPMLIHTHIISHRCILKPNRSATRLRLMTRTEATLSPQELKGLILACTLLLNCNSNNYCVVLLHLGPVILCQFVMCLLASSHMYTFLSENAIAFSIQGISDFFNFCHTFT